MALSLPATAVSPPALDKQHGWWTSCPGHGDESHDPTTFTLCDGGISQLLPKTWISSRAPKQQVVHMSWERGRSKGGACRGPVELGWGRGTTLPQQSCWASLWLGDPRADAWRWWKLKEHRKQPNKGPCITANCKALPEPSYFIPGKQVWAIEEGVSGKKAQFAFPLQNPTVSGRAYRVCPGQLANSPQSSSSH